MIKADVDREQGVDVIEVAALGDRSAAADDLLGGLEDDLQRPLEVTLGDGFEDADAGPGTDRNGDGADREASADD